MKRAALLLAAALTAPAPASAAFKVLSFNVAGVPVTHGNIARRFKTIAEGLVRSDYDLVGIQEAWFDKDALILSNGAGFPHYVRFPRTGNYLGTGLALLSRFPVEKSAQIIFTTRPSFFRIYNGEFVANKGALWARVDTPRGPLDVYDTHLVADYPSINYPTLRLTQIFELTEFILLHSPDSPFVLMGDINSGPGMPGYRLLMALLGLQDVCADDPQACLSQGRKTRIDHVFLPQGPTTKKAKLDFFGPISGSTPPLMYSDHDGVAVEIGWEALRLRLSPDPSQRAAALEEVERAIAEKISEFTRLRSRYSWIPLLGLLQTLRFDSDIDRLVFLKEKVVTARMRHTRRRRIDKKTR